MNAHNKSYLREDVDRKGIIRWRITAVVYLLLMSVCLFLSAGTWSWTLAWLYIGVAALILVLDAIVLIPISPGLLGERARPQQGAKPWDQFLSRWMATLGPLTIWIVSGLDFRYSWSAGLPIWAIVVSISLVFIGGLIVLWPMAENRFFVGMVLIQTERGHQVINSGPYRFMRHPGYLGSILYLTFTPLALDSLLGLTPALFTVGVVLLRTYLEDQTLIEELDGYQAYTEQVHYRLIPGLG